MAELNITPVKPSRMFENILLQLYGLIDRGILKPGERLSSERELAQQFSVNRATLRQALYALSLLRVVEIQSGKGAFVRKDQSKASFELLFLKALYEGEAIGDVLAEIMEIRTMVEVPLAGKAALLCKKKDLQGLRAILLEMDTLLRKEEWESFARKDFSFHKEITRIARNKTMLRIVSAFYLFFEEVLPRVLPSVRQAKRSMCQHWEIYNALKMKRATQAEQAMQCHLHDVLKEGLWK